MVAQVGDDAAAETGRTDIEENLEKSSQTDRGGRAERRADGWIFDSLNSPRDFRRSQARADRVRRAPAR
jgi:hypothetical protein